jgi:hypothetical protein
MSGRRRPSAFGLTQEMNFELHFFVCACVCELKAAGRPSCRSRIYLIDISHPASWPARVACGRSHIAKRIETFEVCSMRYCRNSSFDQVACTKSTSKD